MLVPDAAGGAPAVDGALSGGRFDRWAGPLAAGLALAGLLVLGTAFSLLAFRSPGWAYDFEAYFAAALRLIATGSPYQAETLSGPFRPGPYGLYLYAPPLALLFVPLTWLGEHAAVLVWLGVRAAMLAAACALMPVARPIRLAMFGICAFAAPVLLDLNLGNVSLIVTFAAVLIWRWLDRPLAGVALAAALTLRPTMGVIALWWLIRGRWRPVLATVAAGLVIVVITLPFVGPGVWLEYATVLSHVSNVTGVRSNVDLGSAVLMLGGPPWAAPAALFGGYLLAAGAVVYSLRRDRELSFVVTLTATLLMAPLLWDHYLTHLIIPGAFLASRGRTWGLLLPLAAWIPIGLSAPLAWLERDLVGLLSVVAVVAMLLPLTVPDRGEPAGTFLERMRTWRARRPARA